MKNKKRAITLSIIAIITLITLIVGATYAYFQVAGDKSKSTDVNVTTYTSDLLTFEIGNDIAIYADQTSFGSGKGNATGSTFAKAILTANSKTNTATEHYYMYLNISENTFTYTQDENTPELLLTITDKSGNAITSISGLIYKTVTDGKGASISGFDITTKTDVITLFDNREITASPTKTEEWNITVAFINYNADQNGNTDKNFNAKLLIQEKKAPSSLNDVCLNGNNFADCIIGLSSKGFPSITNIYYHDSNLTNGAKDNSYRFAGEDYQVTSKATSAGLNHIRTNSSSATDGVVNMYCNGTKQYVEYNCYSSYYYTLQYDTTNTQYTTYTEAVEKATSDGYLTKDNIKNFVCFGNTASPCPTDNLYRIIGVIDGKVKLIKYDYATSALLGTDGDYGGASEPFDEHYYKGRLTSINTYFWNYKNSNSLSNIWSTSLLNTTNLNTNFLNNIGSIWTEKIATTTWQVGGNVYSFDDSSSPTSNIYTKEIISPLENIPHNAKIGLMYMSDYGFAIPQNVLTFPYIRWMYMGESEWTITRNFGYDNAVLFVTYLGGMMPNLDVRSKKVGNAVRPVFFLESSVTYSSGSGTSNDPIRINL